MMKKISTMFMMASLCLLFSLNSKAADVKNPIQVEIVSPSVINSAPVYDGTIDIRVKNVSNQTVKNLGCYLTIVDVGRNQTYPVDEFGENAYQTRPIDSLAAGAETTIQIPVHILYVGEFRFTASVIQYDNNQIYTGAALPVTITAVSNLQKSTVMGTSIVVPIFLLGGILLVLRSRKKSC